jgi:hypothetical protein
MASTTFLRLDLLEFTVVGHANLMLRSVDGVNWTTNLLPRDVVLDVAYGNGRYVIAGVSMFSSTNGSDWLPITMPPFYDGFQSVVSPAESSLPLL